MCEADLSTSNHLRRMYCLRRSISSSELSPPLLKWHLRSTPPSTSMYFHKYVVPGKLSRDAEEPPITDVSAGTGITLLSILPWSQLHSCVRFLRSKKQYKQSSQAFLSQDRAKKASACEPSHSDNELSGFFFHHDPGPLADVIQVSVRDESTGTDSNNKYLRV